MIRKKRLKLLILLIVILLIIVIVPSIFINYRISRINKKTNIYVLKNGVYNLWSALKENEKIEEAEKYNVNIETENDIVYINKLNINIQLDQSIDLSNINVVINDNQYKIDEYNQNIPIELKKEGENDVHIKIKNNNNNVFESNKIIYYIKPYKSQYLDKLNKRGMSTHFEKGDTDSITDSNIELLKNLGVNTIRDDVTIAKYFKNWNYDFTSLDEWIKKLQENNIDILPIIWPIMKVNDNDRIQYYLSIIKNFQNHYPTIKKYELLNEPNFTYSKNEIKYLAELNVDVEKYLKSIDKNTEVYGLGIAYTNENQNAVTLLDMYNQMINIEKYKKINNFSYHIYDSGDNPTLNKQYIEKNNNVINMLKDNGGFYRYYVTEYGINTSTNSFEEQAIKEVQQSIINESNNVNESYLYCFRDRGTDKNNSEHNYGIVDYYWHPKLAYYAIKNYYENTSGSEYIGQINISYGIEAHLFDKDGKPKIIAWTTNKGSNVEIEYSSFTAKDLYGNDIENKNGELEISNSPVYLDNVSTNYFYQAISNSITNGYSEFNTKFADETVNVDGLVTKINDLNNQAVNLKNVYTLDENKANELMKEHFELGNMIMSAYEDGKLNIEYVKISSMLDSLNTIGNSYEDLVTVSAKTRITDLTDITNKVNTAKSLAQDNEKFDIVYPNKIYKFAQDLLDTSSYVLGLEEENDIKTGLINSKALHAKYLAEWSQEFSKIYMKDALKDSLNKIIATNQGIKQNYSNVLLDNEINQKYKNLNNSLKEISDSIEKCNAEKINMIYSEQVEIVKLIAEKYYSNEIKIDNSSFVTLIKTMIDTLSEYENLFKYYSFEDNISEDDLVDTLNNVINRYNDNRDIDLSMENEIINKLSETYQNINSIEDGTIKYFNKLNIIKTCEIVSNILEGDIKNKAESEYKAISTTADVDLSKPINKDVTITINLPNEKSKITNNIGSNILKFTENGEYLFNINIRGFDYTYKVTINNIDKTLPKLNIKNTGTSITAIATDNNIKELKIEKDGKEITYSQGNEITNPGIYKILAIDQAGNQSSSKEIIYGTFKNSNSQETKYVPIDKTNTKLKDIVEDSDFTIKSEKNGTINANNKEEINDENVATGDKLIKNGQEYLLVVKGDITKDGETGVLDLINLRKQLVSLENLKDEQAIAADLDDNGKIDVMDLIMERKKIVGIN